MATLINFSLKGHQLPKERWIKGKDGAMYMNLTVAINDDVDNYGNNVVVTCAQTKEERERKDKKTYLGNGRVVWYNGQEPKVVKDNQDKPKVTNGDEDNGLDFLNDL